MQDICQNYAKMLNTAQKQQQGKHKIKFLHFDRNDDIKCAKSFTRKKVRLKNNFTIPPLFFYGRSISFIKFYSLCIPIQNLPFDHFTSS